MIYGNTRYPQRPSVTGAFRGARRKMCNKLRRETKLLPYYAAAFRFNDCVSQRFETAKTANVARNL